MSSHLEIMKAWKHEKMKLKKKKKSAVLVNVSTFKYGTHVHSSFFICSWINIVFSRDQKNRNILLLLSSLFLSSSLKERKKFTFSWNFPASVTCKTSKFVTNETLQLLLQTLWHLLKLKINFNSLWVTVTCSLIYNIIISIILIETLHSSVTQRDFLMNRLYWWNENFVLSKDKIVPLQFFIKYLTVCNVSSAVSKRKYTSVIHFQGNKAIMLHSLARKTKVSSYKCWHKK